MGKLFFCVGKKAQHPYRPEGNGPGIYSMEELCYFICKNHELLDKNFMQEELVDFVVEELGLAELGSEMKQMIHFGGSLHSFCGLLLERTHYLDEMAVAEIEKKIKLNEQLSIPVRLKNKADHYRKRQEYYRALDIYRDILLRDEIKEDVKLQGEIFYQMGTTLAALFYFKEAEECFARSLELVDEPKTRKKLFLCKRFRLGKKPYIEFATQNLDYYEMAVEIEELYEKAACQVEEDLQKIENKIDLEEIKKEFFRMTLE